MKKFILAALVLIYAGPQLKAQPDSIRKRKIYKTWVKLNKEPFMQKGVLYEIRDSSVILSDSKKKKDYRNGHFTISRINASTIDKIKIRENGRVNRSALLGLGAGFVAGGLAGVLMSGGKSDDDTPAILFVASWAGALGAVLGAIIGSLKISIPLEGNLIRFNASKKKLNSYALINNPAILNQPGLLNLSGYFSRLSNIVKDTDGNIYHTLSFAGQVWLDRNLQVTHYRDGKPVALALENTTWGNSTAGSRCSYMNDSSAISASGMLYNWKAATREPGLCPNGWHLPSQTEWASLVYCLGGETSAGRGLTEQIPAIAGNLQEDPFAQPGGFRYNNGIFSSSKGLSYQWWTSTPLDSLKAKALFMGSVDGGLIFNDTDKKSGLPVRCIRD